MSLNYSDYNFQSIVSQLRTILKTREDIWDNYESSTTQMLIELWSYVGEMLMYTIERRAQESYISTAQLRSSVINLVRLINYQPRRKVSSTGTLRFSITAPIATNIYIPKYTECQRSDGIKFLTSIDSILYAGGTTSDIAAIQGEIVEVSHISDGTADQEYTLSDANVENSNLFIYVDNVLWTNVSSFVESQASSLHYRTIVNNDDTLIVKFGDDKYGKIPENTKTILIRYVKSSGSSGNVFSTGVITTLNDTLFDDNGASQSVSVSNTTQFLGGDDSETIEEIRYNAPRIFTTAERAVTRLDYLWFLTNYPSVAAVNVWGENEETPPNYDLFNRVRVAMILDGWNLPGLTFKQTISDFLKTKAQLTVQYEFIDPTIIQLVATVTAKTTSSNSLTTVQSAIEDALDAEFELGVVDIGTPIRYADILSSIEAIVGVEYHHLLLEIKQTIGTGDGAALTFADTLELLKVKDASLKLYKDSTLIGFGTSVDGLSTDIDKSTNAHPITFNGVVLDTRYPRFGVAAARFNGINSYLSIPDHTAFNLSGGIWTIAIQIRPDVLQTGTLYYQQTDASNYFRIYLTSNGLVGLEIKAAGVTTVSVVSGAGAIVANEYNHIEFSENGDSYYLFINGSLISIITDTDRAANYTGAVEYGRDGASGHYYSGHMDEILVIKGEILHTEDFIAPEAPYAVGANTSLLVHMNGIATIEAIGGSGITGTVDYSTGETSITFPPSMPPAVDAVVSALYTQDENNFDLVPAKNQIIRLVDKDVSVSYIT